MRGRLFSATKGNIKNESNWHNTPCNGVLKLVMMNILRHTLQTHLFRSLRSKNRSRSIIHYVSNKVLFQSTEEVSPSCTIYSGGCFQTLDKTFYNLDFEKENDIVISTAWNSPHVTETKNMQLPGRNRPFQTVWVLSRPCICYIHLKQYRPALKIAISTCNKVD